MSFNPFKKFSLAHLVREVNQAITQDPAIERQMFNQITTEFRTQLNKATPAISHIQQAIHSSVTNLKLSEPNHARLVQLLNTAVSNHVHMSSNFNINDLTKGQEVPNMLSALLSVPNAEASDYSFAIYITDKYLTHSCKPIFDLYCHRHTPLTKHSPNDALNPYIAMASIMLKNPSVEYSFMDLINSVELDLPNWLGSSVNQHSVGPGTTSRAHKVLRLYTKAMSGLSINGNLDLANQLFLQVYQLLNMDTFYAFEPNPPFTRTPAPCSIQSELIRHWILTMDMDQLLTVWHAHMSEARPKFQLCLNYYAVSSLWHLFAVLGYANESVQVLNAYKTMDPPTKGLVYDAIKHLLNQSITDPCILFLVFETLQLLIAMSATFSTETWVIVFQALKSLKPPRINDLPILDLTTCWWVNWNCTKTVPSAKPTYLQQLMNLYACYINTTANQTPDMRVSSTVADCVASFDCESGNLHTFLSEWLSPSESKRLLALIKSRTESLGHVLLHAEHEFESFFS